MKFEDPKYIKRKRIEGDIERAMKVKQEVAAKIPTSEARKEAEKLFTKNKFESGNKTDDKPEERLRISDKIIRRRAA